MRFPSKGMGFRSAARRESDIIAAWAASRTSRDGQTIQENTTVSSGSHFTAIGNDVTSPSGTSSPQHSTTWSAPFSFDVRDAKLTGFGVRVLPSGAKRFFIHVQHRGERSWKMVGDANELTLDEARERAAAMRAAIRGGPSNRPLFEAVAETVFERYAKVWKPRTLEVNRIYLRRQLLPWFAGREVADIDPREVQRWFPSLRAPPVAADRSAPVLSAILTEAELLGYRPEVSNPVRGIRRYWRKGRERFLSEEELRRLGGSLSAHEAEQPLLVAAVRLLLLTGCRKSEVLTLRWSDYREGHLHLRDSKSGPRTVWLSGAAREVLGSIVRTGAWVFPGRHANQPPNRSWLTPFWYRVRAEADLSDVRLHDLRHYSGDRIIPDSRFESVDHALFGSTFS